MSQSTMKVHSRVERPTQKPLHSTVEVQCTNNINEVIKKVFEENQAELSAKAASALVALHWESRKDKTTHIIEENDLEEVVTNERAQNYRLVIEDAPPSVAPG